MLLLAYHLLRKKLLAAWKAARKREKTKKMNLGGEPKETAVSRENVPADGSNPAQRNEAGISARPPLRPTDPSATYLSPTGAARARFALGASIQAPLIDPPHDYLSGHHKSIAAE